ncbi:MAG: acetamidase/formamidase family protein [Acetobacteraceae bacterium]
MSGKTQENIATNDALATVNEEPSPPIPASHPDLGRDSLPEPGRRNFLKATTLGAGAVALGAVASPFISRAEAEQLTPRQIPLPGLPTRPEKAAHWYVPANDQTVHWGYFSKSLKPLLEMNSGDYATIECLTHQAGDDPERMIKDDPGAESVYYWTKDKKNVNRRGAGPMNAPNGAGGGAGVHIMTGPIAINGAKEGDILEVRVLDMYPRPCANPEFKGKAFGTNISAWWGYQYNDYLENPKPREVVTIYELQADGSTDWAVAVHSYRWGPFTDPFGVVHKIYDYPGLVVNPNDYHPKTGIMKNVRVPLRPHFGVIGVTPKEVDIVTSIPPDLFGGNVDDWRFGKGATLYYPILIDGALFSVGDTHAAMGDSELNGTAIESSWTGVFQFIVHKQSDIAKGTLLADLNWPLLETKDEWVVHGFSFPQYLAQLGPDAQTEVFKKATVDLAMRDAFRKMRSFLMNTQNLSEDEALSLMSVAVDFGVTQVVDGNWGVHASVKKRIFAGAAV